MKSGSTRKTRVLRQRLPKYPRVSEVVLSDLMEQRKQLEALAFDGRKLKSLREAKDVRADVLGFVIGSNEGNVRNWENGYSFPNVIELMRISKFLECDLTDFFEQEKNFDSISHSV
jgi:DNA-binding XRE family transcriptional regulator